MADFYKIMFPIEKPGIKKRWTRIGSATKTKSGFACTMETIPLNWNGEFYMFPSDEKPDEKVPETPNE